MAYKHILLVIFTFTSLSLGATAEDDFQAFMHTRHHRQTWSVKVKSFLGQTTAAFGIHYLAQFATQQLKPNVSENKEFYLQAIAAWIAAQWTSDAQTAIASSYYQNSSSLLAHALGVIGSVMCRQPNILWNEWKSRDRGYRLGGH